MIITISASYGAGGSALGPRVAATLGARFVDRAISVAVADELGISVEEAAAIEEDTSSRLWASFAALSPLGGLAPPFQTGYPASDRELVSATEAQLRKVADEGNAVILGHAAAVVLGDHPDALHVRLDGAPDGRIRAAMAQHGIGAEEAKADQRTNDKLRSGYVRHFYRTSSSGPEHYHLVLDTVRLGWDRAEELMVRAVEVSTELPG